MYLLKVTAYYKDLDFYLGFFATPFSAAAGERTG